MSTLAAISEASRFWNCPISRPIKSVWRKYVYLWHHEWCHKIFIM